MARNMSLSSMLPVAVGVFLLVLVYGAGGGGRAVQPTYDGEISTFELTLNDQAPRAEVGDIYWADVTITNPGVGGGMWVQCSILDQHKEQSWLSLQSVDPNPMGVDNCVAGEPFTQTARVELANGESNDFRFQMQVPDLIEAPAVPVLYCNAYEQCASVGDPHGSATIVRQITIVSADDNEENDNVAPPAEDYPCKLNLDCPQYLFGQVECVQGFCVDKEDFPSVCGDNKCTAGESKINCQEDCAKASDWHLNEWIRDHKILVTLIALVAILIGIFSVYGTKKAPM